MLIPILITICSIGYAIFVHKDGPGYFSGLENILLLIPALFVSMISWIIWGVLK